MEGRGGGQRQGRRGRVGSGRFQHSPERPSNSNAGHRQSVNERTGNRQNWRQSSRGGDQQRHNQNNPAGQRNLSWRQQDREDENNEQTRHRYNPFSYHNLKKLATEESDNDVVKILANSDYDFEGFIQGELRIDLFHFVIKVLAKVCKSDLDESKSKILGIMCESAGFLNSFMSKIMDDEKTPQERKELVCNILTISETVAQCMPLTACDKLLNIIQGCKFCCKGLYDQGKLPLDEPTLQRFEDFSVALTEKKTKVADSNQQLKIESRNERLQKLAPPDDFRTISAAPTSEDVLCRNDAVFLRPNLVRGKYDSIEHYLDVQFRLLREDFVRPLREGIAAYISGDKKLIQNSSVRLHKDVVFIRSDDKTVNANNPRNKDIEGVLVQFEDPKKKKRATDWEHTRRFMFGSLLCFSKDNFRTLLISTVSDRDLKNLEKGLLRVVFSQEVEENIYHQKYTMVESEVFFDPYFHVLKTLQSLEDSTFPLPEYLIHVQEDDFPPAYLEPKHDISVVYNLPVDNQVWPLIVTNSESWPEPRELGLDNSQWFSLHAALTRELVVIQGPPGTGKTYMGLRIAEILIKNKLQTGRQSPILVVCLTNHALDQFLLGILKYTRKIIRIGGQSKCDELMNFNLRVLKRQTKSRDQMKLIINLKEEIRTLQFEVSEFDSSIAAIKSKAGIVAYEMFCKVGVVPKFFASTFSNIRSCFNKWLMEEKIENGRTQLEVISNVQYCFLVEEFDKSIESLENQKYTASGAINVQELYDIQQQLQLDKEWLEGFLNSQEIATKEQSENWIKYVWKLNIYQKWQLYHYWLRQLEDCLLEEIRVRENEILKKNNELSELQIVDDLEILREADVVGMTTTGAARLHKLLRKLGPEIVIVEEAAEVMEAHVVACLTEKCCHLILIGDHKQLRPQIATYELEKKFNFDISLFERMVINRDKCITLEVQHRMAPEIAQLITPSVYLTLKNADNVKFYPEITGVPKRLFFIDHSNQEEMVDLDSNSRINRFEATFIIALCRHLILQGYDSSKITILTTYRGQMFHIRKLMKGMESLKGVLAQVVDNYQGEENDIILLSLVRSNPERRIGFLATENRVCVALSRAKHALYIVGDMSCLTEADKVPAEKNIWIKIKDTLKKQNAIGKALTLKCDIHPEQVFTVSTGPEFSQKAPEGGCRQLCRSQLLCTHPCNRVCHVLERDHVGMKCQSPCMRFCDANLHLCKKKCYETCGDCMVDVEKTLACGHKVTLQCHVDPNTIKCNEIVSTTFKPCNHQAEVKCHIDPYSTCPCDCDHRLPCGHSCVQKCHFNEDQDHLLYVCKKPCGRRNAGCSMNHECGKRCCDPCAECIVKVPKELKCGHSHYVKCSEDIGMIECNEECTRVLTCGHKCKRKCKDNCNPCLEKVKKRSPCGHEIVVGCGIVPERIHCDNKCTRQLQCGHPCTSTCNKPCTVKCLVEMYTVKGACGHQVPLLCWERQQGMMVPSSTSRCSQTCPAVLNCGHMCSGTCGTCYQGRFHSLCDMPCGRVLVCGHPCKQPCAVMCPPCQEKCSFFCNHSKCPKKCGEPCAPCKERCQWQCEHKKCKRRCGEICDRDPCDEPCPKRLKCGHDCIGFCGEPCPKLCRSCNADEVTDIFFGTEDEPDARFINLVDCGHSIEVEGMKNWMAQNDDMVSKKSCPRCTKTISRSLRFGNDIKQSFFDICKVKKRLFGDTRTIEEKRKELETKVEVLLQECMSDSQDYDEMRWFLNETLKSLGYMVDKRKNVLSSTSIRCKEIEVDIVSRVCEVWQKSANLDRERRGELQTHMNLILENLEAKKHRLSQQQVIDFELEVLRLQRILQFLVFKHEALTRPNLKLVLERFKAVVLDFTKRYSLEKHQAANIMLNEMKELCKTLPGLGITDFERKSIVQALRLNQGHWFKCPNGHPYIITECGGAMQESVCPECGARIGGGGHRLRDDNSHFRLMDGATHAAWSEQANLGNYNFDFND